MSVFCSAHNLDQFHILISEFQKHYYSLCLLSNEEDTYWPESRIELLWERVSVMSDTLFGFEGLERCIRAGRDFNAPEPELLDDSAEQGAEPPVLFNEPPEG